MVNLSVFFCFYSTAWYNGTNGGILQRPLWVRQRTHNAGSWHQLPERGTAGHMIGISSHRRDVFHSVLSVKWSDWWLHVQGFYCTLGKHFSHSYGLWEFIKHIKNSRAAFITHLTSVSVFNFSGLFLVTCKATTSDFLFHFWHASYEQKSSSRKSKRQLFLSLSPDRLDRSLLRLPAGSQWRCEAPFWVWRLHWISNKGTVARKALKLPPTTATVSGFGKECGHVTLQSLLNKPDICCFLAGWRHGCHRRVPVWTHKDGGHFVEEWSQCSRSAKCEEHFHPLIRFLFCLSVLPLWPSITSTLCSI